MLLLEELLALEELPVSFGVELLEDASDELYADERLDDDTALEDSEEALD